MQHFLTPYAKPVEVWAWWDNIFTDQQLNELQNIAKAANTAAQVGGAVNGVNKELRRSNVSWLSKDANSAWVFEKLAHVAERLNAEHFRFDLTGFGEALQMTHYDQSEQGMYGWHTDFNAEISRKLSLVVQLTDPSEYEGGNLQLMAGSQVVNVNKRRGLVAAFPSYLLHQVTPVTQGNRQSLVTWVSGPAFR